LQTVDRQIFCNQVYRRPIRPALDRLALDHQACSPNGDFIAPAPRPADDTLARQRPEGAVSGLVAQVQRRGEIDDGPLQQPGKQTRKDPVFGTADRDNFQDVTLLLKLSGQMLVEGPRKFRIGKGCEDRLPTNQNDPTGLCGDGVAMVTVGENRRFGKALARLRSVQHDLFSGGAIPHKLYGPALNQEQASGPLSLSKQKVSGHKIEGPLVPARNIGKQGDHHMIEIISRTRL